jgi:tetratricopeptide (TPR) repeat protein
VLDRDPLSPIVHRNRSMYLRDLGRYELAGDALDQAEHLGLKLTHERATLAFESGDQAALDRLNRRLAEEHGDTHLVYVIHQAGLEYLRGDTAFARNALERLRDVHDALVPAFVKWLLALCSRDLDGALRLFGRALDNREHLAFTWRHGSVGMRRHFPWYYESEQRQTMLRRYGLNDASVNRLKVPPVLGAAPGSGST